MRPTPAQKREPAGTPTAAGPGHSKVTQTHLTHPPQLPPHLAPFLNIMPLGPNPLPQKRVCTKRLDLLLRKTNLCIMCATICAPGHRVSLGSKTFLQVGNNIFWLSRVSVALLSVFGDTLEFFEKLKHQNRNAPARFVYLVFDLILKTMPKS